MVTIGLTGGIATGKSTVGAILKELKVPLIDSDELAHQAMEPGAPGYSEIIRRFGVGIVGENGWIDRKQLGRIVFDDPAARNDLEQIIHPRVIAAIKRSLEEYRMAGQTLAVVEIPLLFEVGLTDLVDRIWVVSVSPEIQLQRLIERGGLSEAEARLRISAQLPLELKEGKADVVIYNNKGVSDLRSEVVKILNSMGWGPVDG
jgi:dephospho-CoA kinase